MNNVNKTYNPIQKLTIEAQEDIPQYRFVDYGGNLCTSAEKSFGVSEINWLNQQQISVITLGTAIIETDSAVALGDNVTSGLIGKAKTATGGDRVNGRALDTTATPGFIRVLLVQ